MFRRYTQNDGTEVTLTYTRNNGGPGCIGKRGRRRLWAQIDNEIWRVVPVKPDELRRSWNKEQVKDVLFGIDIPESPSYNVLMRKPNA